MVNLLYKHHMSEIKAGFISRQTLSHRKSCLKVNVLRLQAINDRRRRVVWIIVTMYKRYLSHFEWLALGPDCTPQLLNVFLLVSELLKRMN